MALSTYGIARNVCKQVNTLKDKMVLKAFEYRRKGVVTRGVKKLKNKRTQGGKKNALG